MNTIESSDLLNLLNEHLRLLRIEQDRATGRWPEVPFTSERAERDFLKVTAKVDVVEELLADVRVRLCFADHSA